MSRTGKTGTGLLMPSIYTFFMRPCGCGERGGLEHKAGAIGLAGGVGISLSMVG
jgi:hypothetical protein